MSYTSSREIEEEEEEKSYAKRNGQRAIRWRPVDQQQFLLLFFGIVLTFIIIIIVFGRLLTGFISSVSPSTNQTKPKAFSVGFLLRPDKKTDGFFFPDRVITHIEMYSRLSQEVPFWRMDLKKKNVKIPLQKNSNKIRNRKKKNGGDPHSKFTTEAQHGRDFWLCKFLVTRAPAT